MKHLSPTDPVPALRGDVVFSRRPTGSGAEVIHIRPIGFGESTRLHGFELSLLRMLDGRRSAQDVVSRAARIGLPLSVPALEAFIRHLEEHGLIARTEGEAASALSPWSERAEWTEEARLRYRAALEAIRAGRPDQAKRLLDQLVATDPELDDARAMREWLIDHPEGLEHGEAFVTTFANAEAEWLGPRAKVVPLEGDDLEAVRRSWLPLAFLLAVVAAGFAILLVPLPRVVSAPAELTPAVVTPIEAPGDVTVADAQVDEGQLVKQGDVLVTFNEGGNVIAPVDGVVGQLRAVPGLFVPAGTALLELGDLRELRLIAQLDPVQASDVQQGQTATISLGTSRAKTVVDHVDGDTVVATVDNAASLMRPGQAVLDIDVGSQSLLKRMTR